LVGAGPGDPDLLTVKAQRLFGDADVVIYDRLVSAAVLDRVPAGTARVFVGKASGRHSLSQDEINALMLRLARAGRRVVRLKGGDPFVFGRGSEEALYLARHGIAFEVVPGITAAAGCAAAIGVPLTHRGLAGGVRFMTGHGRDGAETEPDWASLADLDTTLVLYMALANLNRIRDRLIAAGLPPDTPAVAVANGTTPDQRVVGADLATLGRAVVAAGLEPPVLVIIGRVAALLDSLGAANDARDFRVGHG